MKNAPDVRKQWESLLEKEKVYVVVVGNDTDKEKLLGQYLMRMGFLFSIPIGGHTAYQTLREDNARYIKAFSHTHVAKYADGKLADECRQCGLDLRDPVHARRSGGGEG